MEAAPVSREETLRLGRAARQAWVKVGNDVRYFGAGDWPPSDADIAEFLVHPDGWMRVPVLVEGSLLVRGYTEALYRRALLGRDES